MIGPLAFMLLSAAATATPCESLAGLKLDKATITSSQMVRGPTRARTRAGAANAPAPTRHRRR
jgi:hypothetical protein